MKSDVYVSIHHEACDPEIEKSKGRKRQESERVLSNRAKVRQLSRMVTIHRAFNLLLFDLQQVKDELLVDVCEGVHGWGLVKRMASSIRLLLLFGLLSSLSGEQKAQSSGVDNIEQKTNESV